MALSYKDHLKLAMEFLAEDPMVCFTGYNLIPSGGSCAGTLKDVSPSQINECPLAECLMSGVAIGMSLAGYRSVLIFERFDFIHHALDALSNHLLRMNELSGGIHKPACIIRVAIGKRTTPLFTEPTHCFDYTNAMREMMPSLKIKRLMWPMGIEIAYKQAYADLLEHKSTLLVEDRDLDATT